VQKNVLAMSGRAVEAAGDIDVLLLDKTGTITLGNRQATEFLPLEACSHRSWPMRRNCRPLPMKHRKDGALSSWPRNSACGCRSIAEMPQAEIHRLHSSDPYERCGYRRPADRKGAPAAIRRLREKDFPPEVMEQVDIVGRSGGTSLVVAEKNRVLGVIHLKDIVKGG